MIRVAAVPESIDATPGFPVSLTLTIANTDPGARTFSLRLVGIDPGWVAWPDAVAVADGAAGPTLSIEANETIELPVVVTLPPGFPSGAQLIGIEATVDGVSRPALGSLQLSVADIDGVRFSLSPAAFRGGRSGRFRINVANRGREPITIDVSGRAAGDDPAELKFEFKPKQFTLRTEERVRVKGKVTGKRPIVGGPRIRPMTIVAQSNSAPLHADARFTQRPLLSRRVLRVFGIFIALSMWAGALVTAVRWSGDRAEQTAEDASAVIDEEDTTDTTLAPGESVMVDTDGDGEPDTEMIDTDGDGKPDTAVGPDGLPVGADGLPSGPVLSGQVTGIADRSGITVEGQYVELASAIPAGGEGEEVAAQGIGDGRKGKLYAAGVTSVDTDDPAKAPRSTVTDENGFWKLAGVAEGNWQLTFTKEGFGTRTLVVPVEEGVEPEPIEIEMAAGNGSVGGLVSTEAGPLGGAVITVTDGALTFTTTTPTEGDVGRWQIDGLSTPGTYLVSAELRGFGTQTSSVTLGASGSDLGVDLTLVEGVGSIQGVVTGSVGGEVVGLGGITVTAASDTVTREVTTLTDDPAGSFLLPQLPIPGDYTLTITGANWVPQTQLVHLEGATELEAFVLQSTTASINGTVEGPDGALDAVGITVSQDDPLVKTLSASEGEYEVVGLMPGTYTVTFERFGFETQSTIVELAIGDSTTVDMTLAATPEAAKSGDATVKGIVRNGITGQPITGVAVAFQGKTATSVEGGTFTITGLAAGTGDLALTHAMYQATSRTVRLGVKAEVQVDITMLPLGGLQGQITDLTATPISGVSVTVAAQTGTAAVSVPAATTDANGEYSILQSFPTGSYVATFSKTGFGTQTREFEAAAGSNSVADIQLVELGTITGGLQEPGGGVGGFLSLSNVTVKVEKLVNGVVTGAPVFGPVVRTGSYTVTGLEAGDYRVTATHPDFTDPGVRDLIGLKLREVRDGGIVMARGSAAVSGQVYFAAGTGRVGVTGATITAQVVTGYTILPTFPFISPSLQSVTTSSVAAGTMVNQDGNATTGAGGNEFAAPVDGYYVINPQPVSGSIANYQIAATGYTTRIQAITSPTAGGSGDIVLIPNPKDISGSILLSDAANGTSVVASLSSPVLSETITAPTLTTAGGGIASYSFNDLAPGDYTVTFTSSNYHTVTDTISILVTSPEANPMGSTTLERKSSLTFTVNGVAVGNAGVNGQPVAGASVTITSVTPAYTQTVVTDAAGSAAFTGLRASDEVTFTVSKTGFEQALTVVPQTLANHFAPTDLDIGENEARTITLRKHPDLTVNVTGRIANLANTVNTDTLLNDASVTLTPSGGGAGITLGRTATNGQYLTPSVTPGAYQLTITAPQHQSLLNSSVTLSAGTENTQNPVLSKLGTIQTVVRKIVGGTESDLVAADIVSPATISVTATPTAGGSPVTMTRVGATATFEANGVATGAYSISASATGYSADTDSVTAAAGSTTAPADGKVVLSQFSTLTVQVTRADDGAVTDGDSDPDPVDADLVTATPTGGTAIPLVRQGAVGSGTYQVAQISNGTYTIRVEKAGYVVATPTQGITAGVSPTVTVLLLPYPDASVTVRGPGGAADPINNATVTATPTGGGTPVVFTATGAGGVYTATAVPTGSYTLSAVASGYATRSGSAGGFQSKTDGTIQNADAILTLTIAASITLDVNDGVGGGPLAGATVLLRAVGGANPTSRQRFTGDDGAGKVVFNELVETSGFTYSITVSKAGYETQTLTGVTLGSGESKLIAPEMDLLRLSLVSVTVNSSLDPDGAGATVPTLTALTGATVTATVGSGSSAQAYNAIPLGSGVYLFPALPDATWTITATAANHTTSSYALNVNPGTDYLTETLSVLAWPTQTVTVDSDASGSYAAVSGATVTATRTGGPNVTFFETAVAGTYRSNPLEPSAAYTISAAKDGFTLSATGTTGAITAGNALTTTPNLLLAQNPTQTIEVREVVNGAASVLSSGATVTATRLGGPTYTLTETANGSGQYISPRLEPGGAYTISASKSGYTLTATQTTAAVQAGTPLTLMSAGTGLVLNRIPILSVTAIGGFDDPAEDDDIDPDMDAAGGDNAVVTATSADGAHVVTLGRTGAGTYSTSQLNANVVYTIGATKSGYTLETVPATFTATPGAANGTRSIRLGQHPDLQVDATAGLVAGPPSAANADTDVSFTLTPTSPPGALLNLADDAVAGRYTYASLAPGTYSLNGTKANHTTTAQTVTVTAGRELAAVSFELLRNPTLRVSLTSSAPAGDVNDAVVTATNTSTGDVIALTFEATGDYAETFVPPGTYNVLATGAANHGNSPVTPVTVSPGVDNVATSITVPRFGTLTVRVNSSSDADGIGVGGAATLTALTGAAVTATNTTTGAVFSLPSIGGGDYSASLPPATYSIAATASGHSAGTAAEGNVTVSNAAAAPARTVNLLDWPDLVVDVDFFLDASTNQVLTGATVTATPSAPSSGPVITIAEQGTTGQHQLLGATPGTYVITASKTGYATDDNSGTTITLVAGEPFSTVGTAASYVNRDLGQHPSVTVLVSDGTSAITDAVVTLTRESTGDAIVLQHTATAGTYTASAVLPVAAGGYTLTIARDGFATFTDASVTVVAGTTLAYDWASGNVGAPEPDPVALSQHPLVTVLVTDAGPNPDTAFGDAQVTLTRDSTSEVIELLPTTTLGTYDGRVEPGTYTLRVEAQDYGTWEDPTPIVITAGSPLAYDWPSGAAGAPEPDPVALSPAATLTVNVDSVLGASDTDLSGATVNARNTSTGALYAMSAVPGTPGAYRSSNLPAGTYDATASATGHTTVTSATDTIGVGDPGTLEINLLRYPDLTVTLDDGAGAALLGATVGLTPSGGGTVIPLVEVGTAGTYQALAVTPGDDYVLSASKTGYLTKTDNNVDLVAGTVEPTLNLVVDQLASVTVRLQSRVTLAGVATLSELTNAVVTVEDHAAVNVLPTVTLDHQGDGVYTGFVTDAGDYDIVVSAPGHAVVTDVEDDADDDGYTLGVNVALDESYTLDALTGSVTGTVRNITNVLQGGVSVSARSGSATIAAVLTGDIDADADDGVYLLSGLAPGVWELTFTVEDMAPLTIVVTVPLGSSAGAGAALTGVNVVLAPTGGAVNGQVLAKAANMPISAGNPASPLDNVTVALNLVGGSSNPVRSFGATSAATGAWFGFGGLTPGSYTIELSGAGLTGYTGTTSFAVTVLAGEIVTVDQVFYANEVNAVITTSLADGLTDVNGVNVTLTNPALISPAETQATASGTTTFTVPYGTYTMTVSVPAGHTSIDPITRTIVVLPVGPTNIDHRFSAIGTISGTTMQNDDATATTLLATYDEVVSGVTVTVSHTNGYRQEVTSGPDGTYTATNIPIGTGYTVTFEKDGYVTDTFSNQTVARDTDLTTTTGDLDVDGGLDKLASFVINVQDSTTAPLAGASVSLFQDDDALLPVTAYLGGTGITAINTTSFQVTGLDPTVADKVLNIRGSLAGYFQNADPGITLIAGDNGSKTLTLVQDADLTIQSVGIAGGDDLEITLNWTRLGVAASSGPHAFDNSNTAIPLTGLPASVSIVATKTLESGFTVGCSITAGPGGDLDGTFTLAPGSANTLTYTCS